MNVKLIVPLVVRMLTVLTLMEVLAVIVGVLSFKLVMDSLVYVRFLSNTICDDNYNDEL